MKSFSDCVGLITAIFTAITALGTLCAAIAAARSASLSKKNIEELKMHREIEMRPVLGISSWDAKVRIDQDEHSIKNGLYPAYLFFSNLGRSYAQVLAVELHNKNITAHIGLPLNIGSGEKTHVKIWLPCKDKEVPIKLSLYYWDIENRCFRTELFVYLTWTVDSKTGKYILYARVDRENVVFIDDIEKPKKVRQWPKCSYLYPPWWDEEDC